MYPTEFAYHAPTTLAEAITLLDSGDGDTKVLAGGQSLLPLIKLRVAAPTTLIDLGHISDLRGVREEGDAVVVGAMTTYRDVLQSDVAARKVPLMLDAIRQVGDMQVRARGTIGGSLAHADPAGDLPAVALALDAEVTASGSGGARTIALSDFFVDMLTTALTPQEVLTAVRFPAIDQPRTGWAYLKHRHPASGYAVVGVAAVIRMAADGTCSDAKVAITGASDRARRAAAVERALTGTTLDDAAIGAACDHAADDMEMLSDAYASGEFRAHLTRVLSRRAVTAAVAHARERTA